MLVLTGSGNCSAIRSGSLVRLAGMDEDDAACAIANVQLQGFSNLDVRKSVYVEHEIVNEEVSVQDNDSRS